MQKLMLNSTEHEIYHANKCKNAGILTFIRRINTTPESSKTQNLYFSAF